MQARQEARWKIFCIWIDTEIDELTPINLCSLQACQLNLQSRSVLFDLNGGWHPSLDDSRG